MILEIIFFNLNPIYAPTTKIHSLGSCWRGVNRPRAGMANGNTAIVSVNPDSTQRNKSNYKAKLRYDN